MGLPGTVLGIPGYLVSRDPLDSTPGGTTWDCPGYPGILSTSWVCDTGVSHVSRDVPSCPGTSRGSTGHPSSGAVYVNITRCHGGQSNHWYVHKLSNSANCAYHFIPFYLHNTLCGVL